MRYILNLAGLRKIEIIVAEEVKKMAVEYDWSGYPAVQEAAAKAEAKGMRNALLLVLEKRFAPLPAWARQKIENASKEQVMEWLVNASDAVSLTSLIRRRQ
ncbi:MAG: hypothetical protein HYX27_08655 [Acidobacteria bacterium]|nr:hypothetical protein [Acidobacteriota bacterium]